MQPITSVKEARKLLGKEYERLTDERVAELVGRLHQLAKVSLDMARERLTEDEELEYSVEKCLVKTSPEILPFHRRSV